jgi:hypothetical protein
VSTFRIVFTFVITGVFVGLLLSGFRTIATTEPTPAPERQLPPAPTAADALRNLGYAPDFASLNQALIQFPELAIDTAFQHLRRNAFLNRDWVLAAGYNLDTLVLRNPCYIPLYYLLDYRDSTYLGAAQLYNDTLSTGNPFKNRFAVAEFNTTVGDSMNKGVHEFYPMPDDIPEFAVLRPVAQKLGISIDSLSRVPEHVFVQALDDSSNHYAMLYAYQVLVNYHDRVGQYHTQPIRKKYNHIWRYQYNTGQHLCMCEARRDTLVMVARFATSGKAWTKPMNRHLPVGRSRNYYAPFYTIGSRCWEWGRKYTDFEAQRDELMGGGSTHVTIYEQKIQLPNFMLLVPRHDYNDAMHQNGIHTQALPYLLGGMLGTPNSMGCWRVTNFASRFVRWWVPKHAKVFVYYTDQNYFHVKTLKETPKPAE